VENGQRKRQVTSFFPLAGSFIGLFLRDQPNKKSFFKNQWESSMRKKLWLLFAIIIALLPLSARAQEDEQQFSLSLDLLGDGAFAHGGLSFSPGLGSAVFGDWRPLPYLSLGTGFDFTLHSDDGSWQTASWDLGGRIFPLPATKQGEWYLQGTLGLNLVTDSLQHERPANFHGVAGAGYRFFVNPGNALDLGVQYDLFSPLASPIQAVGVKAGWTLLFGNAPGQAPPVAKPEPTPQTTAIPTPVPVSTAPRHKKKRKTAASPIPVLTPVASPSSVPSGTSVPLTYTWQQGDNLVSIAEAFYGTGDDFPLLVDANIAALGGPSGLKPGVQLLVPQNLSDADEAAAVQKAGLPKYAPWKKVGAQASGIFGNN
jgi:nucleoid-associated protein YgaU